MPAKRFAADLLFGVQILFAIIFGGGQIYRMLTTGKGVSISWFVFWEVFLLLNLVLAMRAHRNQPSRVTRQALASYVLWVGIVSASIVVMLVRKTGHWQSIDTVTTGIVALGVVVTIVVARIRGAKLADPIIKGWYAVFFKGVPQTTLAANILIIGSGAGLAGSTLIAGHVTVLTRLGQVIFSVKEAGWDRNRMGSALSEMANELSWVVVTIAWLATKA